MCEKIVNAQSWRIVPRLEKIYANVKLSEIKADCLPLLLPKMQYYRHSWGKCQYIRRIFLNKVRHWDLRKLLAEAACHYIRCRYKQGQHCIGQKSHPCCIAIYSRIFSYVLSGGNGAQSDCYRAVHQSSHHRKIFLDSDWPNRVFAKPNLRIF